MFDLSIAEIGVIGVVALLVLGPERLPKAARTLGFYVKKARQSWFAVRSEFERELATEELKRSLKLDEVHATLQDTAQELRADVAATGLALGTAAAEARASVQAGTGPDPLPAALMVDSQPASATFEPEGLSAEEVARQGERQAPEPAQPLIRQDDGPQPAVLSDSPASAAAVPPIRSEHPDATHQSVSRE